LSTVLGVPISFFYEDAPANEARVQPIPGFAESPPADSNILEFLSTREGLELNKAFSRISDPKQRRAVLDLVRSLAGVDDDGSGGGNGLELPLP
jgi:hypothetical protein